MEQTVQLAKNNNFKTIEKHSSFYLKIEKFDRNSEKFTSKKIEFLDVDAVWWVDIFRIYYNDDVELKFFLQTNESISSTKIWSYRPTGSINGKRIDSGSPLPIVRNESSFSIKINLVMENKKDLEVKLQMAMTVTPNPKTIPLEMFINTTVQRKKISSNNKWILNESKYSDFTFIVNGQIFKVHKNILAAASTVFNKLFTAKFKETQTNKCIVTDIEPVIFEYLLNFIYSGELPEKLQEENVPRKLFTAAHYYEIGELVDICKYVEHYKLSMHNAVDLYEWAFNYELEAVKMDAWKIIKFDILEIFDEMEPPSPQSISFLIANKNEKDECLKEYRFKLNKLQTAMKKSLQ